MIDYFGEYMTIDKKFDDDGYDEQRILLKSISNVLPIIMKNELTPKQYLCLRLFYVYHKSQREIAQELKVSQPTVCAHINTAKDTVNKYLNYCFYVLKKSNEQWLKYAG